MDEKAAPTYHAGSLAVWLVALALHAAALLALWVFHNGQEPLVGAVALGLLVLSGAVFSLPGLFAKQWYPLRSTIYGLTAVLTICIPVLGILGCLCARLCANLLMRHKNKTRLFRESLEATLGEDTRWITKKRVGQVLADEIAIEPVVDVLQGDDPDLKRGAVNLLKRIGTKSAVGLLRSCLSDPFPEVRFYAHSALSELEDNITQRIQAINKTLETAPSAAAHRALGLEYRTYADSGLADETARDMYLESARDSLAQSLALEPEHPETMLALGQALLELKLYREAAQMFEQCLRHEQCVSEAQLGLAQIAYETRDFGQLAAQARSMALSTAPRPQRADPLALFEFWSSQGKAPHA